MVAFSHSHTGNLLVVIVAMYDVSVRQNVYLWYCMNGFKSKFTTFYESARLVCL
jgi:hypothetical protein